MNLLVPITQLHNYHSQRTVSCISISTLPVCPTYAIILKQIPEDFQIHSFQLLLSSFWDTTSLFIISFLSSYSFLISDFVGVGILLSCPTLRSRGWVFITLHHSWTSHWARVAPQGMNWGKALFSWCSVEMSSSPQHPRQSSPSAVISITFIEQFWAQLP